MDFQNLLYRRIHSKIIQQTRKRYGKEKYLKNGLILYPINAKWIRASVYVMK